ncbi:MAG: hypothetical protein WBC04_03280 [Candidatus Acidiferrales bacterium]
MRKIFRVVWSNWVKPLIVYALLWASFRWLDFDNKQSIAFTVLFGTGYFWLKELDKRTEKTDEFTPYRVTVQAKNYWYDLVFKYRFVKDEEERKRLCEKVEDNSILRRG